MANGKLAGSGGEQTTTNYQWIKPTVGASLDNWGGYLNADLDDIDQVVKGVSNAIPVASTTPPVMDGAAAVGAGTTWARADHIHPTDTSRASVAYVDAKPVAMNDNRIINGDMRIDQRNNGASGTATGVYTVDRWVYAGSQASKGQWQRLGPGIGLASLGFTYCLSFTSTSAYASLAADTFNFAQKIEADMVTDFSFGTANAQPVTLSFLVQSTLTGTFSGSLANDTGARAYPFAFSIPSANTWTKIVVTIPGDTAGTWVMNGNGVSMFVRFDLGCGTNSRGSANAWASVNYVGVTGAVSVVGTNAAAFYVTGVKLEIGSVATPYNRQSLAKSLADCQRYYQGSTNIAMFGSGIAGQWFGQTVNFPCAMRAAPTITYGTTAYVNSSGISVANQNSTGFCTEVTAATTAATNFNGTYTASAEL